MATPFDGTTTEAFAVARPHLEHLQTAAAAREEASSSSPSPSLSAPMSPTLISVHVDGLPRDGMRTVELPCGLTVGSHMMVVARTRAARQEYDPKIAEQESGQASLMVSQFMVELVGTKVVEREAPHRILHFNARIHSNYSGKVVIEMNSYYRMQWEAVAAVQGLRLLPRGGDRDMVGTAHIPKGRHYKLDGYGGFKTSVRTRGFVSLCLSLIRLEL